MDQILRDRYLILTANYPVDNFVLNDLRNDIVELLREGSGSSDQTRL